MSAALALSLLCAVQAVTTISGQVLGADGDAARGARVFAEPGLGGALIPAQVDETGRFTFDDIAPGPVGVFAWAEGCAFGGAHVNVVVADRLPPLILRLGATASVSARVVDQKGDAVSGARVTRVALLGADKVAIPLAKLQPFGVPDFVSGEDGRITLTHLPAGGKVALKIAHAQYAQEGVNDIETGGAEVKVTLSPGVVLQGEVLSRAQNVPISNATVVIQNAQPPHDSALAQTDGLGLFSLRLKPGVYLAQAHAAGGRSAGWQRLTLTGEAAQERTRIIVGGIAGIRGEVKDAISGAPIEGARVALDSLGNRAAVTRTGPTGEFHFHAVAGENVVTLEAAPGYLPPPNPALRVQVEDGAQVELPGMWLKPVPDFRVQVIGETGEPVPGAVVSLLRPFQFGWRVCDAQGWVTLDVKTLAGDAKLIGLAEHPTLPQSGLFQIGAAQAEGSAVQLFRCGTVQGLVESSRGKALPGVVVGAMFPGETPAQELLLWRTLTDGEGRFSWPAIVPGVPQRCVAKGPGEAYGESPVFNLAPDTRRDLGVTVVEAEAADATLLGERLDWRTLPVACGSPAASGRALVVYCPAPQGPLVVSGLDRAAGLLLERGITPVAIVEGGFTCVSVATTVLRGSAPAAATTYIVDENDIVQFQCFGLPPLSVLAAE